MRILTLITARGGSKRLPGKNIRSLGGKPLVVWSIDVVKNVPKICDILVSTDDPAIATICKEAGAYVPWLRPADLASDAASSVDATLHALDWYEAEKGAVDGLLLLQPTSPFRSRDTLIKGIRIFHKKRCSVIAVSEVKVHPSRCFYIGSDSIQMCNKSDIEKHQPAYAANGSFYLITPATLRQNKSFLDRTSIPMIIHSPKEALDIDTEWDWLIAESLLRG